MPVFRVTSPTGRIYEITGPEGSTMEEAIAYAQQHFPDPEMSANEPGLLKELGSRVRAGFEKGKAFLGAGIDMPAMPEEVARGLGYESSRDATTEANAQYIADQERKAQALRHTSMASDRGMEEIQAAEGWVDSAKAIARNPRAVAGVAADSIGMSAPILAGTMAAGAAGGGALIPLLVGGGSGAIEYGASLEESLGEAGVDLTDPNEIRRALDNPALMESARERAAKRGVAIGAFDALTAGLAGRLLAGARGTVSAGARAGGELGLQAGGGMAGEAAAQLSTDGGISSPAEVLLEGVAEMPTAVVEVPANYRTARDRYLAKQADRARSNDVPTTEETSPNVAELPPKVAERHEERAAEVAAGTLQPGVATVEDMLDEARNQRGMPLDVAERSSSPPTPAPATPIAKPAAPSALPGLSVDELLEQHRSAVAAANDKTQTPEARRAAKKRSQYLMSEIEVQNSKPRRQEIEQVAMQMLDQAAAPAAVEAPVAATPPTPALPSAAPAEAPPAPAPVAPAPVTPLVESAPLAHEIASEKPATVMSHAIATMMNNNAGFLRGLRNDPNNPTPAPLTADEVVEVRLAPKEQKRIDQLGRLLGRKIVLYDIKTAGGGYLKGFAGDDRHIFVNPRAVNASQLSTVGVIGHEFLHTLRKAGNPLVAELVEYAKAEVNVDSGYVQSMFAEYKRGYAHRGLSPDKLVDVVSEELVADFVGDMMNDAKFWAELERSDPSLFRKTLQQLIDFVNRFIEKAYRMGASDAFEDVTVMRDKAATMLREHIRQQARIEQEATQTQRRARDLAKRGKAPARDEFVEPDDGAAAQGKVKAKLDEEPSYRRELVERRAEQEARSYLERGDYMNAARVAARASATGAPGMPIDTAEKRQFFKESSRAINAKDTAQTLFHGTARDITKFKPKQGNAVFMSPNSAFSSPYAASSQAYVNIHERQDVVVGGQSMRQQFKEASYGSTDWMLADLLLRHQDPVAALHALDDYAYMPDHTSDINYPEAWEVDEIEGRLRAMIERSKTHDDYLRLVPMAEGSPGMSIMPLVTNVAKPWDFENKNDVKRLMAELRALFTTPRELRGRMANRHGFDNWGDVEQNIRHGSWTLLEDEGLGIPELLKEMGYDGYHVAEEGIKNLAVFDPKQIKSATGNVGPFGVREPTIEEAARLGMTLAEAIEAQSEGDIRLSLGSAMRQTFTALAIDDTAMRQQLERWFLDEFRDVREVQRVIGKQWFGGRVPADMDVHGNENLRHGAFQDARNRADERYIGPIGRVLSRADASIEEFSDYLWWRHAPERDAYLRKHLAPGMTAGPADLAGISPADATKAIASLDPRKRAAFERAAKFIDGLRRFTLDQQLASGQISQALYDSVLKQYQFYVPLRGMPDGADILNGRPSTNRPGGISMSERALGKRATGRKSKPDNIIEEMMRDMDLTLVGVQNQKVLNSLVRLIAANPDPDLWEVQPVVTERKWANGVIQQVPTNGTLQNQITLMHHGVPVRIEIRHEGMRKAFMNLNEPVPKWLRRVGRVTRWLSAVKTMYSPFFLLVNPVRDAAFATMGMGAEHGMSAVRDMARFMPHTYGVLARDQRRHVAQSNDATVAQLQQYAREFGAIGGKTGYTHVHDIREQQRKLHHLMDRHAKSKGMADIMAGNYHTKDATLLVRKGMQHVAHTVEVVNDMLENSTRLAVYAAMREKGWTVEEAGKYAKEVTVNFNRRGSIGKVLNSFYMFFNAAIQGTARMARLSRNPKFVATMGSLFATSYGLALGQMLAAGDDDDGESVYDKAIPARQAERTLSIHLGDDKSLAIPVPYGPNMFSYAGYRLAKFTYDQMRGKDPSVGAAAGDIAAQMSMSMSPIDPGRGATALLPEAVRVPTMAAFNRSDFGGPISGRAKYADKDVPLFRETETKTSGFYRTIAEAMNGYSGGSSIEPGAVNWTGEQVRYTAEQLTGGMGRLASESAELIGNLLAGIDPEPSDVPLANVYYRGKGEGRHANSYFENMDDYDKTVAQWKMAVADGNERAIDQILERAPWVEGAETDASTREGRQIQEGSVMQAKRDISREMRELRKEKDAILADPELSRREKKQQAYAIDLEIAELQQDFNYEINVGRGRRVGKE